jgi:VanZ family protein
VASSGLKAPAKKTRRVVATILAILWAALIFVLSSIPGSGVFPEHPDILNVVAHFGLYLVLAALLCFALDSPKRALWITALIAWGVATLYGVSDELHQFFTPGRSSDPFGSGQPNDLITDTVGSLVGAVGVIWFISAQKVKKSRAKDAKNAKK